MQIINTLPVSLYDDQFNLCLRTDFIPSKREFEVTFTGDVDKFATRLQRSIIDRFNNEHLIIILTNTVALQYLTHCVGTLSNGASVMNLSTILQKFVYTRKRRTHSRNQVSGNISSTPKLKYFAFRLRRSDISAQSFPTFAFVRTNRKLFNYHNGASNRRIKPIHG